MKQNLSRNHVLACFSCSGVQFFRNDNDRIEIGMGDSSPTNEDSTSLISEGMVLRLLKFSFSMNSSWVYPNRDDWSCWSSWGTKLRDGQRFWVPSYCKETIYVISSEGFFASACAGVPTRVQLAFKVLSLVQLVPEPLQQIGAIVLLVIFIIATVLMIEFYFIIIILVGSIFFPPKHPDR